MLVVPKYLNFAIFYKDLLAIIRHIMILTCILVTGHEHIFIFVCVLFQTSIVTGV